MDSANIIALAMLILFAVFYAGLYLLEKNKAFISFFSKPFYKSPLIFFKESGVFFFKDEVLF